MFNSGFWGMDGAAPGGMGGAAFSGEAGVTFQQLCQVPPCLCRTDSRTLVLKNNTLLPMVWQLSGLDDLVEDFSLSQDKGTVDPRSELEVTLNFKARQIGSIEKTLRLEVRGTVPCLAEQGTVSSCVLLGTESGSAAPDRHRGAVTPNSASAQRLPEHAVRPHPPR